jgi:hypothetical protein
VSMTDRNDTEPDRYQAALRHSRSYDAGNYDAAYTIFSCDAGFKARSKQDLSRKGYILGFFSSYEPNEIPEHYREEFNLASAPERQAGHTEA